METMAITQYVDVAQLVLYLFWIFFFGLVYYLVQEGHRDGYPLDSGRTPPVKMDGWPPIPKPKTYLLADGKEVVMPYPLQPPEFLQAEPRHRYIGAPIEPTGNPLLAGVGPGSWANRADVPDHTPDGEAKIVPLRTQPDYGVATQDNDPRGLPVVGDDDEVAALSASCGWIVRKCCSATLKSNSMTRIVPSCCPCRLRASRTSM